MHIPMSCPDLGDEEERAVAAVARTQSLSMGARIAEFEARFATSVGQPHAVAVNSGTSALHLAVIAAGVRDLDLVITSPFSFVASSNAVLYERGVPIFVDVDPLTGNIDPSLVNEAADAIAGGGDGVRRWLPPSLRSRPVPPRERLRAILPVHCFGQPADMSPLLMATDRHALTLIEDSCEAIGAEYRGQRAGTFGHAAAFGFFPNKQITTGEGGMVVTRMAEWDGLLRSLRNQGRDAAGGVLEYARLGYNYRLDEMSAALGLAQLCRLDELIAKRERVASWYTARLTALRPLLEPWTVAKTTTRMSWFVYVVKLHTSLDREALMSDLDANGIPSRPYFPPIHLLPFYRERFGYKRGDFPVAEDLGRRCLALPFSSVMSEEQVDMVTRAVLRAVHRQAVVSTTA